MEKTIVGSDYYTLICESEFSRKLYKKTAIYLSFAIYDSISEKLNFKVLNFINGFEINYKKNCQ